MLLGIDIGGTHTDAVLIDREGVRSQAKVETIHDDLVASLNAVLEKVLNPEMRKQIRKVNLSTTLTTNAIVENRLEPVGILAVAGPGLAAEACNWNLGKHFHLLPGAIDHRGRLCQALDRKSAAAALANCRQAGVRVYAAVSKFSTRNPEIELELAGMAAPQSDFTSIGHRLSGRLNFPRRLATAYYNAAVWRRYNAFVDAVSTSLKERFAITAPLNILKADGGTIDLGHSRAHPVQTILSGPAASVMGIIALCEISEDAIILDIGGTTTDIAIFADGAPLLERDGVAFGGRPTLVRAIRTHSLGIGGDSRITITGPGEFRLGPERRGVPLALGGPAPTLIDAANRAGLCRLGEVERSAAGCRELAAQAGMEAGELAEKVVAGAVERIRSESLALLEEINEKPVYTVAEVLHGRRIEPRKIYVMGGPAALLAPRLAAAFELDCEVPEHYAVANAVGAALTRTTMGSELFADTGRKTLQIPNLGFTRTITRNYSLEEARAEGCRRLLEFLRDCGHAPLAEHDIAVVEAESFNVIDDFAAAAKTIRVSCQIRPGLEPGYRTGRKESR